MKRIRLWWFGWLVLALGFAIIGCNAAPAAHIVNANLGTQVQAGKVTDPKDTFAPKDHMIQLVVDLENVLGGTTVGAKWYSVPASGQDQLLFSSDLPLDPLNTSGQFALTTTSDFATGKYKVVLYLNGKQDRTLNFQVQ